VCEFVSVRKIVEDRVGERERERGGVRMCERESER